MRKNDIASLNRFAIQTYPLLVKEPARFALACGHLRRENDIQHSLLGLQIVRWHLVWNFFLLEGFYKSLLCSLSVRFAVKDASNFKRKFHLGIPGVQST